MNTALNILFPFAGGLGVGLFFFGGLWLTVRRGIRSKRAVLWIAFGSLIRVAVALYVMYLLTGARWEKLLPCVAGFYAARHAVTRLTKVPEDGHAS